MTVALQLPLLVFVAARGRGLTDGPNKGKAKLRSHVPATKRSPEHLLSQFMFDNLG